MELTKVFATPETISDDVGAGVWNMNAFGFGYFRCLFLSVFE
ncbi:hypothetical protein O9992_29570 [Vibrio lentus]|nr:hypothetical protein [Vibrio lentus]